MIVTYLRNESTSMSMTLSNTAGGPSDSPGVAIPERIGLYGKYPEQNTTRAMGIKALARKIASLEAVCAIAPVQQVFRSHAISSVYGRHSRPYYV